MGAKDAEKYGFVNALRECLGLAPIKGTEASKIEAERFTGIRPVTLGSWAHDGEVFDRGGEVAASRGYFRRQRERRAGLFGVSGATR